MPGSRIYVITDDYKGKRRSLTMIKLVAVDLDGTLLTSEKNVTDDTIKTIRKVMDKGIYFVISSGRNSKSAAQIQKMIGAEGQPMILHNGAIISDGTGHGRLRVTDTLSRQTAKEFMTFCRQNDLTCAVIFGDCDEVVLNRHDADAMESFRRFSLIDDAYVALDSDELDKAVPGYDEPNKMLVFERDPAKIAEAEKILTKAFGARLSVYKSGDEYIDAMPQGMNKGTGLSILMKELGIKKNEVMAIGDSGNDVGMLKLASLSVAMKNGEPYTKKAAKFITDTNDNEGVKSALEKFISVNDNHRNLN